MACSELESQYQRPCASISWAERSGVYADTAWPILLGDPVATGRQAARALGMIVFGGGASLLSELTGVSERVARLLCPGLYRAVGGAGRARNPLLVETRSRVRVARAARTCVHVWHGAWRRGLFAVSRTGDYALRDPVWRRRRVAA